MINIVLGMHRSGTSTVAGILHLHNIIMGTYQNFWPRPLKQNPKGFYENYDFRKVNDTILKHSDYNVKSYNSEIPNIILHDKMKLKMSKIIKNYSSTYIDWGWKDPRTCLTIFQWIEVIESLNLKNQVRIIFVSRKAISVARSLKKRNNLSLKIGLSLWEAYSKKALQFCKNSDLPIFYCSFESLLETPNLICNQLFKFLDKKLNKNIIDKFIDKNISKNNQGEEIPQSESITMLEKKIKNLIFK